MGAVEAAAAIARLVKDVVLEEKDDTVQWAAVETAVLESCSTSQVWVVDFAQVTGWGPVLVENSDGIEFGDHQ